MHEAILEYRLDDGADAVGDRIERRELRLHIGGERRIRGGANVDRVRPPAAHVHFDPGVAHPHLGAGFLQLDDDGVQMLRPRVLHAHVAAGDRARDEVRAALDPIGQHLVSGAVEPLDAFDDDAVGAGAP